MFGLAALIPSPPVLVPELCGGRPAADDAHLAARVPALREAVLTAVRELAGQASRWTVVGVDVAADGGPGEVGTFVTEATGVSPGPSATRGEVLVFDAGTVGTFRGYGADVRVALSDDALEGNAPADPDLPLPVLIGGWVRGCAGAEVTATARLVDHDAPVARCVELGERLRRELDAEPEAHGVLVIADGAATLSTSAPGYLDPRAQAVQDEIDDALSAGDRTALTTLDTDLCAELGVSGRAAYQVLAGLFSADVPKVETLYRAAPFGVGYQVSTWRSGNAS
ncbi:hypothetical protein [Nocardia jiangxiensis]|uniref:Uncharacterized protein n=1 Tax=Nocardia jiangxiensis TaxID=282685 RepID=A0ABW6RVA3_9NOCA|nr:hypothetical protein [Nocardia jiangxiensis]